MAKEIGTPNGRKATRVTRAQLFFQLCWLIKLEYVVVFVTCNICNKLYILTSFSVEQTNNLQQQQGTNNVFNSSTIEDIQNLLGSDWFWGLSTLDSTLKIKHWTHKRERPTLKMLNLFSRHLEVLDIRWSGCFLNDSCIYAGQLFVERRSSEQCEVCVSNSENLNRSDLSSPIKKPAFSNLIRSPNLSGVLCSMWMMSPSITRNCLACRWMMAKSLPLLSFTCSAILSRKLANLAAFRIILKWIEAIQGSSKNIPRRN